MLTGSGHRQRQQLHSRGHNGYSVQQSHCRVNPACSELLACQQGQATGNNSNNTNPHTVFKDAQGPLVTMYSTHLVDSFGSCLAICSNGLTCQEAAIVVVSAASHPKTRI